DRESRARRLRLAYGPASSRGLPEHETSEETPNDRAGRGTASGAGARSDRAARRAGTTAMRSMSRASGDAVPNAHYKQGSSAGRGETRPAGAERTADRR